MEYFQLNSCENVYFDENSVGLVFRKALKKKTNENVKDGGDTNEAESLLHLPCMNIYLRAHICVFYQLLQIQ